MTIVMRWYEACIRLAAKFGVSRAALNQLIRYGTSGAAAVCADYGSFTILLGLLKTPLLFATVFSLLAGFVVSFVTNRIWVFRAHHARAHKRVYIQLVLYSLLFVFNTAFTYAFIHYMNTMFGLSEYVGKFCCILLIMIWNFVLYKRIIFRVNHDSAFPAM